MKNEKIGRNDPCSCGSGKKFKKCCLLKQEELEKVSNLEWEEWFAKDCLLGEQRMSEWEEEMKNKGIVVDIP